MAVGKKGWNLEDLVDFEVAVHQSPAVEAEVGREVREGLRSMGGSELEKRRWGLRRWLQSKKVGSGMKVVGVTRFVGLVLLIVTFLLGVGVVRGMVTPVQGRMALNMWVLLAGTVGIQWVILLGGLATFFVLRYWTGGLGWMKDGLSSMVRKLAGKVSPEAWQALIQGKGKQPSALAWRLTRILQVGGIGFNLGLIGGLFGVLFFMDVAFYWESSLSRFGGESLGHVTRFLAGVWGGSGLSDGEIASLRDVTWQEKGAWDAFFGFIFAALCVWGATSSGVVLGDCGGQGAEDLGGAGVSRGGSPEVVAGAEPGGANGHDGGDEGWCRFVGCRGLGSGDRRDSSVFVEAFEGESREELFGGDFGCR